MNASKGASEAICRFSKGFQDQGAEEYLPISATQNIAIVFELLCVFLHFTYRFALAQSKMSHEDRKFLMDTVLYHSVSSIFDFFEKTFPAVWATDAICVDLQHNYLEKFSEATIFYSGCISLVPTAGEISKGTLFWECGKRVAAAAGREMNPVYITLVVKLVAPTHKGLNQLFQVTCGEASHSLLDVGDTHFLRLRRLLEDAEIRLGFHKRLGTFKRNWVFLRCQGNRQYLEEAYAKGDVIMYVGTFPVKFPLPWQSALELYDEIQSGETGGWMKKYASLLNG